MMKLPRRKFLHLAAGATALPGVSRAAWAQAYPSRPVRAVVAFAPGGTTDTFARLMAQKLTEQLGKQVYVENIAGATGNIGTGQVAKAPPDGYTILFAFSSHVVNPTLFARLPYDPINDFKPVTLAVASTTVITVNPAVPAKTVEELVELIKANPGKYSFSSAGAGTQARCRSASTSFTCPSAAAGPRSRRWSPGTRRSASARRRLPCSTSRKEPCGRSRSPARRARKSFPTCRP
jgi:tripartite-type tricarboxylate transporter receptor subunit TctC